jgi:citrate lyase subunit beta/citryl-CoA lyase
LKLPITYLFVPGNRPERFDKALGAGADAVIVDLEDAVTPGDKATARAAVGDWYRKLGHPEAQILVRINDAGTSWFAGDLEMIRAAGIRAVMLPKAEQAAQVDAVRAALPEGGIVVPIIESARGLANVQEIAAANGVQRLAFGNLDYAVDLDLSGDERGLADPSARIALASRIAGIATPIGGVTPELGDAAKLLADLAFARAFGFGAKLCIHPRQVAAIHQALKPTPTEIGWAERVIAAAEANPSGAVQVDGKMVDRPVILKARGILERAA